MASIEIITEATEEAPSSVERLDVIVWGNGGQPNQQLCIGSGANFDASSNYWLEIRYSVQDVPVFYTRNVLSSPNSLNLLLFFSAQKLSQLCRISKSVLES